MPKPCTALSFSSGRPTTLHCDALVLAAQSSHGKAELREDIDLPRGVRTAINASLTALGADGSTDDLVRLVGVDKVAAPLVLVVGMGAAEPTSADAGPDQNERIRRAAGRAARSLGGKDKAAFALGTTTLQGATAAGQGALLGSYAFQTFYGAGKSAKATPVLNSAIVVGAKPRARERREMSRQITAEARAVSYARDLVNTPPNELYPESFATSVTRHAGSEVSVDVWDPERLATEGCGGIIGVGQGSARGPRLVTLRYAPKRAKGHLAFVGKGITFDSGGLCIKPAGSMITMKCDMGGAAAVAAAIFAIAEQQLPVAVTGYLCLAENMTGDLAQRPGDVVTMRGGTTVEIINTDAEGRLVMADGLVLASEEQPDAVIDIATLTGAATIALGERTFGVMGNHAATIDRMLQGASTAGESAWQLPLVEELRAQMDSPVADIKHTGDRSAGAMIAATFLAEFIGTDNTGASLPWVHLDIAGPAFNDKSAYGYTPKGGTGAGVRALIEFARSHATRIS
ncbi:MAG: leucyl aminopeptidase [Ornithinimicrobium sp.]